MISDNAKGLIGDLLMAAAEAGKSGATGEAYTALMERLRIKVLSLIEAGLILKKLESSKPNIVILGSFGDKFRCDYGTDAGWKLGREKPTMAEAIIAAMETV